MNRRFLFALTVFMVLLGTSGLRADGRAVFEEAERRFTAGNYALAIERYERVLTDHPGSEFSSRAHFRIAQSQYYLGSYETALDRLQRAAVRAPAGELSRRIRFWIGLTSFQLGQYPQTIDALDRYLSGQPEQRGRAHLYRGLARSETGDPLGAQSDLEGAIPSLAGQERGFAVAVLLELYTRRDDNQRILDLWRNLSDDLDTDDGYHEQRVRFVADAAYAEDEIPLARTLYNELVTYSLESAQWGYQRLYAIARDAGEQQRMQEIFRQAERRLAVEPQRMTDFWLSLGLAAIAAERHELAELHLFRVWEIRSERAVPGTVPYMLARALARQGRPEEALEVLLTSMDDPHVESDSLTERHVAAARILLGLGRPEEAVAMVAELPERTVDSVVLYMWTFSLYRADRASEALEVLDRNQLQPVIREQPDLVRLRARLQLEQDRPADAVRTFRDYLADRPGDTAAHLELIRALVGAEQFSAAAQESNRIDHQRLGAAQRRDLTYLRGLVAFHDSRFEEADRLFQQVDDPGYEPLRSYHMAWARYRLGQTGPAREALSAVIDDLPDRLVFDGGYLYSWILYQSGRNEEAIRRLLTLLGASPDRERELSVRQLLATVYLEERAIDDALTQYRRLIELADDDPRRSEFWSQYASTLAAVGYPEEAVEQYDELQRNLPETRAGRNALLEAGQILYTEGRYEGGRDRFRTYQNRYPAGPERDRALYWAGITSLALNEGARALLWWEPLIQEFPRSTYTPRALIETAEVYANRGQQRHALELYDRFVAAYPNDPRAADADRERRRIRLELDGLSGREAQLWVELEPADGTGPEVGADRWFELVLELGRIAIREQISLTTQRNRIVEYLLEAARLEGNNAAQASVLLAEFYRRRGETRAAIEQYVRAASIPGVSDEIAAQSLYELAVLAREQGDTDTMETAVLELQERFADSVWADRAERLMEQIR